MAKLTSVPKADGGWWLVIGTAQAVPLRFVLAWGDGRGGHPANPHLRSEMWATRLIAAWLGDKQVIFPAPQSQSE